ncbi:VOC family protein [Rufibacter latericius]|uniref:VOC family protein n=1 Tax=Rufibacter latericius TaxID=2487040 RepID=A0A3M9N1X9_9BACT|nr:VOC family protein [Rufibacter latericius]
MALNQVTVSVHQMPEAVAFYKNLGLHLIVQSPHYARFVCPDGLSTFSAHLHQDGTFQPSTTTVYFECAQVDQQVLSMKDKGYVFEQDLKDQPWAWREAYLRDPSGNLICLYYAGQSRVNPEWRLPESKHKHLLTPVHLTTWLDAMQTALNENDLLAL